VLAHDPCSVLRFGPLERVADGLGMVGGGLLDPVEYTALLTWPT
jgi:hypothetical protein